MQCTLSQTQSPNLSIFCYLDILRISPIRCWFIFAWQVLPQFISFLSHFTIHKEKSGCIFNISLRNLLRFIIYKFCFHFSPKFSPLYNQFPPVCSAMSLPPFCALTGSVANVRISTNSLFKPVQAFSILCLKNFKPLLNSKALLHFQVFAASRWQDLYLFPGAAITEFHKLGGLKKTEIYSPTVLEAGILKLGRVLAGLRPHLALIWPGLGSFELVLVVGRF